MNSDQDLEGGPGAPQLVNGLHSGQHEIPFMPYGQTVFIPVVQPSQPPPTEYHPPVPIDSPLQQRISLLVSEGQTDPTDWNTPLAFNHKRHSERIEGYENSAESWRVKDRMKTVSVALVMCLNVGVDPPDVFKPNPCARMECWLEPAALGSQKAVETIGNALQKQYERWQPRARYKQSLDPTIDDIKKLCISLRKSSKSRCWAEEHTDMGFLFYHVRSQIVWLGSLKLERASWNISPTENRLLKAVPRVLTDERVLFHYTGHGVPKPTANGEVWVFNKNYTQYIPLSVYDLQNWMGVPSIYVYDCSNAGIIVESFLSFAASHQEEYDYHAKNVPDEAREPPPAYKSCIHLAACAAGQELPTNPLLPADLFTACLTTPIKMALRWYTLQNKTRLLPEITLDMIDKIPGQMNDRRTMLGELNWIFTAVTDTIAWNSLPRDLFHRLFRQDLLVASLFRNFLLAERVMRSYKCSPISFPNIPHSTAQHPMWDAWDFALDSCLCQLPAVLDGAPYLYSNFFTEQLTAFQVWLTYGNDERPPPEQLPIVLQVLLSQNHRSRALGLLGMFVDLGPWAVNQALSVGIFPYVLKLLQSSARELRPLLVTIWAKILAVDQTCQSEIIREQGHKYFFDILADSYLPVTHRTMAAFVISRTVADNLPGKDAGLKDNLIPICLEQLLEDRPVAAPLRTWIAICLGVFWTKHPTARWAGVRELAYDKLVPLLEDASPEVRAAALYALGTFMGNDEDRSEHANSIDTGIGMQLTNLCCFDASPLVRMELIVALQWLVLHFEQQFTSVAKAELEKEGKSRPHTGSTRDSDTPDKRSPENATIISTNPMKKVASVGTSLHSASPLLHGNVFQNVWKVLTAFSRDPFPRVARAADTAMYPIISKFAISSLNVSRADSVHSTSSSPKLTTFSPEASGIAGSPSGGGMMGRNSRSAPPTRQVSVETGGVNEMYSGRFFRNRKLFDPGPNEEDEMDEERAQRTEAVVTSNFTQWCGRSFALPMAKVREDEDPSASRHFQREWKYMKNRVLRISSTSESQVAALSRYDSQIFMNRNLEVPTMVRFDLCEPLLYVADRTSVSTWNYERNVRLGSFTNTPHWQTRISDMAVLNAHDNPFLLIGADDGSIRVWKNISRPEKSEEDLVTAWQALPEIQLMAKGAGMVLSWEPVSQFVVVAGDAKILRVWNAEAEARVVDIPTRLEAGVSCLCSEPGGSGVFAAGYQDGSVRIYDRRLSPFEAQVMVFDGHASPIVSAKMPENVLFHKMYSASVDGEVKTWDARLPNAVSTVKTLPGLTAMDVHQKAEVFCCGSSNQTASVYSLVGTQLSSIRHYEGFMGQRIGPVSALAFHPLKTTVAVACTDSFVSVYAGTTDRKPVRQ